MMRSEAELDRLHGEVVARLPDGLTKKQFRIVTLESADEDGRVYPHSISVPGQPLAQHSLLFGMWFDGLLEHRNDGSGKPLMHQPIRYFITNKGRSYLTEPNIP